MGQLAGLSDELSSHGLRYSTAPDVADFPKQLKETGNAGVNESVTHAIYTLYEPRMTDNYAGQLDPFTTLSRYARSFIHSHVDLIFKVAGPHPSQRFIQQ